MGMKALIKALKSSSDAEESLRSDGGMLHGLPYSIIWTAKGYGRQAMATAAVAALVVRPTTVAIATLHNKAGSGKLLVIERAFAHQLVSTAAAGFHSLWLCVHPIGQTAPTNDITVRNGTHGKSVNSVAMFDNGATVTDDGWFPWGNQGQVEATGVLPGSHVEAEVGGRIIIPETAGISMSVVAAVVGNTFTCGFHWFEVPPEELAVA